MQRYFAKDKKDEKLELHPDDFYHIKTVMRMKPQDEIEVIYQERLYICQIEDFSSSWVLIQKEDSQPPEILKRIILVIPLLKEQKMDFILQKATELGVSDIIPYEARRSVVKLDSQKMEKKYERWQKILKEASEQSKRNTVANLHSIHSLEALRKLEGEKIVCSTTETEKNFKMFLQSHSNYDTLVIVIGPEGGLEPNEEDTLEKFGYQKVSLGPRIMRVETVPVYVLSILNYESME